GANREAAGQRVRTRSAAGCRGREGPRDRRCDHGPGAGQDRLPAACVSPLAPLRSERRGDGGILPYAAVPGMKEYGAEFWVVRAGRLSQPPPPVQGVIMMAGTLRVRRSRGALSGLLLMLLGIWGALIPFIGPYFNYAYTPDRAWQATSGRMWLEVLPGAVTLA